MFTSVELMIIADSLRLASREYIQNAALFHAGGSQPNPALFEGFARQARETAALATKADKAVEAAR